MRRPIRQFCLLILIVLALCSSSRAQDSQPSSKESSSQSTESQELSAALALGDTSARIAALQVFLDSHPDSDKADAAREGLVRSLAVLAEGQLASRDIDQALGSFRRALNSVPKSISEAFFADTLIRIPLATAVRGYRAEAVALAKLLEPYCADAAQRLGALGELYVSLEEASGAIRVLEEAAGIAQEDVKILRTLGTAYRMSLRLNDAKTVWQRVAKISPADQVAFYELGNLARATGSYEEAVRMYRRQLDNDPDHTASLKGIVLALAAQGKTTQAESELQKISQRQAKDADVTQDFFLQTQLAIYHLIHGKLKEARRFAEQAVATEPRFTWGRIAAAEVELAEERFFEAERHLLAASQYGNFPSLYFALGRLYLMAEDYDYSLTQFYKAFSYSEGNGFAARLGGILDVRSERLADLHVLEQQASLYIFEPVTPWTQFRLIESLVRFDAALRNEKRAEAGSDATNDRSESGEADAGIAKAAADFIDADATRGPFRALYIAQKLALAGKSLDSAVKFAEQALEKSEAATEPAGSLRDYPNYDRAGRLQIFRGRAADAKGWALLKMGRTEEAVKALNSAVEDYGDLPEGRRARWHLGTARETAGDFREALELYISAYERPADGENGDLDRGIIESLYRRVNGSLDGLQEKIGKPTVTALVREESRQAPQAETVKADVSGGLKGQRESRPAGSDVIAATGKESLRGRSEEEADGRRAVGPDRSLEQGGRKFEVVIPDLSSVSVKEADRTPETKPVPVVLPVAGIRENAMGGYQVTTTPVWNSMTVVLPEAVPPPPASTPKFSRARRAAVDATPQHNRPRRIEQATTDSPQSDQSSNTRKRRVRESADRSPEKP